MLNILELTEVVMNSTQRSPRAPSISLAKAVDKALAAYAQVGCQALPTETLAEHLGYATLNSGRALATLASLRYFGLLESLPDGTLALSATVAQYQEAADETTRRALRLAWLHKPAVFASLLERFPEGLPSDAVLHQELIQRGFQPSGAQNCAAVLRLSAAFAGVWSAAGEPSEAASVADAAVQAPAVPLAAAEPLPAQAWVPPVPVVTPGADCIPVRLSGGRRAWLLIPAEFHEADKARLHAQIDLLLTSEQDTRA